MALGAYVLWGVLPVYWKLLAHLGAPEILAHRVVWSVLFLVMLLSVRGEWGVLRSGLGSWRMVGRYALAAALLSCNWGLYIWAVNSERLVEASLGYYINPLVSVVLGSFFLKERLGRVQWLAVALAGAGVVELTIYQGAAPWLALTLAVSFGFYGLTKKLSPLGAVPGLAVETALMGPLALGYLGWLESEGRGGFGHGTVATTVLLVLAGVVTSMPLLLFAGAARTVRLSTLGLLQYVSPTIGVLLGTLAYGEPFSAGRAVGFVMIWGALGLYWHQSRVVQGGR